jgi:hypothetical protein
MGNAKAFRIEREQLERMFGYQWVFHIGLANRFGTILSDPHELAWVAGNCLYELERNWGELMGRSTDRAAGALESRYTAHDIAEIVFKLRRGNGKPGGSP